MPPTYLQASRLTQSTKIKRSQVRLTAWVISYFKEKNLWGVCNRRFVFLGPGSEIPGSRETQQRGLLQRLHLLEGEEPDAPRLRRLHKTFSDSFRKRKRLIRTIILRLNFASSMFLFVVVCVKKIYMKILFTHFSNGFSCLGSWYFFCKAGVIGEFEGSCVSLRWAIHLSTYVNYFSCILSIL